MSRENVQIWRANLEGWLAQLAAGPDPEATIDALTEIWDPQVEIDATDAPALDAAYLRQAAQALDAADAVFGPAVDGGYTLVGLKRPAPELFAMMQWSHPRVMADTRERIAARRLHHVELPVLHDIDEPADLVHLPESMRSC